MDFDAVVTNVVESVPGAMASVIMANDGVPLAEYRKAEGSVDIQTLAVEYTTVINEIKKASEILEAGALEELMVRSEGLIFVLRLINEEFYIAAALTPEGNYGKGRYMLRVTAPRVAEEL